LKALCRDCLHGFAAGNVVAAGARCPACGSPRIIAHAELDELAIAHIDCDAFYASVEKRDDPSLKDKPVIVGGGRRGVVSAACYIARLYGVRSAMPMFKALAACPNAVVVTPDMAKYSRVGGEIREMMRSLTPLVEPLSIDEAFLDLAGTAELHHGSPARSLARLALEVERRIGVTVSIGLSYNKSLAKIASDLDKPRGFAMIGRGEAVDFLGPKPVGLIWGVGKALQARLAGDGIATIADLRSAQEYELVARYGSIGRRLYRFARGEDDRRVDPDGETKSISAETTFDEDIASEGLLAGELWPLCETVSRRMKRYGLLGRSVHLKLKTSDFKTLTRSRRLSAATQLGEALYQAALPLLKAECTGRRYRLIGVGAADLAPESEEAQPDLLSSGDQRQVVVERVMDKLRARLGEDAIRKGRGLTGSTVANPGPSLNSQEPGAPPASSKPRRP
jgi:DNA polymerase-4